jgi:hypothetical protein
MPAELRAAAWKTLVVLTIHAVLLHALSRGNVVAAILAAGSPTVLLGLAALFVLVRVLAIVFLPGLVLGWIVLAWFAKTRLRE